MWPVLLALRSRCVWDVATSHHSLSYHLVQAIAAAHLTSLPWASLLSFWSCHCSQSGSVRRESVPVTPWLQREQHFPPFTQSTSQGPLHGFLTLEGLPSLLLSSCPMAPSTAAMFASVSSFLFFFPHFSLMHLIQTSGPLHLLCALLGVLSPSHVPHGSLTPLLQVSFNRDSPLTIPVKILVPLCSLSTVYMVFSSMAPTI